MLGMKMPTGSEKSQAQEMPVDGVERSSPEPVVVRPPKIVRPWEMSPTKRRTPSPQQQQPLASSTISPVGYMMYMPAPFMASTPLTAGATYTTATFHSPAGVSSSTDSDSGYHSSSGNNTSSSSTSISSPETSTIWAQQSRSGSRRRQLSQEAVTLMENWYRVNFDHPYPSDEVVEYICDVGKITRTQVKKWMANRRVRSFNTLPFNGSVHPRKIKRMQRIQQYKERYSGMSTSATTSPRVSPYSVPSRHQSSKQQLTHPHSVSMDTSRVVPLPALPLPFMLQHGLSWSGAMPVSR